MNLEMCLEVELAAVSLCHVEFHLGGCLDFQNFKPFSFFFFWGKNSLILG